MQQTPLCADNGVLLEDDKPVLPGLPIRAATLPALTRLVVNVFSKYLTIYFMYSLLLPKSRNSVVRRTTGESLSRFLPGAGERLFCSEKCSYQACGSVGFVCNWNRVHILWGKTTFHFPVVPWLRMRGIIPPFPPPYNCTFCTLLCAPFLFSFESTPKKLRLI